ncbi:MAG TPA: OmpA family protein [Cytophagaceae bacterium]|nr:OmpA family protein [Cytophagaceae bacterium]
MKGPLYILFIFISFFAKAQGDHINALALKNGCRILVAPPSFYTSNEFTAKIDAWTKQALLDESGTLGWCSAANIRFPYRFVFELAEDFVLDGLYFDTQGQKELRGICTHEVQVEVSSEGPDKGFSNLGFFTLKEYAVTEFKINPIKARWIKLSILSNYGNAQYTQLQEFKAFGSFAEKNYDAANIVGLWDTNFEWVSINRNENGYIYGCYKWEEGELYSGTISRRNFNFKWSQKGDGLKGWAILTINKEGTRLNGIWGFNENYNQFGFWEFKKNSGKPNVCDIDAQVKNIRPKFPLSSTSSSNDVKNEQQDLQVRIQDAETGSPLSADIVIADESTKLSGGIAIDGLYQAKVSLYKDMKIEAKMKGYLTTIDNFNSGMSAGQIITRILKMSKLEIGKAVVLHNIIFQQSRYELLKESYPELDKIAQMMVDNPQIEIEILGHTDNQGDPKQNLKLSEERVNEVKKYLVVNKDISASRIKGVGFGGTQPISSNDKEETRKLNRRVEFKIVKM